MKENDSPRGRDPSEIDESVLRDFFADELPAEMPAELACRKPGSPPVSGPARRRWRAALVIAACLVLSVWLAVHGWTGGSPDPTGSWQPVEIDEFLVIEATEPLEELVYQTADGTVAQSAKLQWTTVSVDEPATGDRIQMSLPELVIVVNRTEAQPRRTHPGKVPPGKAPPRKRQP
ncbi:MAG: hypothetical protein ACYST0_12040 [Planctomycetota bacterium]|jgi:hypothetical protein